MPTSGDVAELCRSGERCLLIFPGGTEVFEVSFLSADATCENGMPGGIRLFDHRRNRAFTFGPAICDCIEVIAGA